MTTLKYFIYPKMWEIIVSLILGWIFGTTYTNRELIKLCMGRFTRFNSKREPRTPSTHAVPRPSSNQTCTPIPDDMLSQISPSDMKGIEDMVSNMMSTTPKTTFEQKVTAYEEKHNSRVIFINHGKWKNNVLGVDLNIFGRSDKLSDDDAQAILDILRDTPHDKDIDLILHTDGGSMASCEVIVKALLSCEGQIRIHIPYYAKSAGTFLALTGHQINIGKGGWLTQVDPQLSLFSAASIVEYTDHEEMGTSWISDLTRLGRIGAEKAITRATDLMECICENRELDSDTLNKLFVVGKSNHDKPLTEEILKDVPNISFGIDDEIMELYQGHLKR